MKRIKKVNEVEYTPEDIKNMVGVERIMVQENIKKLGIKRKKSSQISKETYNKIINGLRDNGELTLSYDEINKKHMDMFNCPYIEPKNNE